MSDLVGNPNSWFSHLKAHLYVLWACYRNGQVLAVRKHEVNIF